MDVVMKVHTPILLIQNLRYNNNDIRKYTTCKLVIKNQGKKSTQVRNLGWCQA